MRERELLYTVNITTHHTTNHTMFHEIFNFLESTSPLITHTQHCQLSQRIVCLRARRAHCRACESRPLDPWLSPMIEPRLTCPHGRRR